MLAAAREITPAAAETILARPAPPPPEPPDIRPLLAFTHKSARSQIKIEADQEVLQRWWNGLRSGAPYLEPPKLSSTVAAFVAEFAACMTPYLRANAAHVGRLAARLALAYRDYRRAHQKLAYDDMIGWTRKLLDNPDTLRRLRAYGYRIILDEAQDTDGPMFAILTELARPLDAIPGTWPDEAGTHGPDPGRFSFVGDDQQAIYGDRADLDDYARYVSAFANGNGGERLEFSVTMRAPRTAKRWNTGSSANSTPVRTR